MRRSKDHPSLFNNFNSAGRVKYNAGGFETSPLVGFEMKEIEDYIGLESVVNSVPTRI